MQTSPGPEFYPAPRWALTRWLSASSRATSPEVGVELVGTMFRRMPSLVLSALVTIILTIVAAIHRPTPPFKTWLVLDGVLVVARLAIIVGMMRSKRSKPASVGLPLVDLFVLCGTLWCGLLGVGAALCIESGDLGLGILGCFLAMGAVGGLSARNPGVPRLAIVQMVLIILPLTIVAALSTVPLIAWIVPLSPLYLYGMISINLQLHQDYVELIASRIAHRHLALHCPLTKLPNRTLFQDRLAEATAEAARSGAELFVLYLDLDGFKQINDRIGHPMGDLLLKQVAARLLGLIDPLNTIARLGGDEFALLLKDVDVEAVETIARSIIGAIDQPFRLGPYDDMRIGVSVGIARHDTKGGSFKALLAQADLALYAAKRAGKGQFCWYGTSLAAVPPAPSMAA